jgi:uncharacterized protein
MIDLRYTQPDNPVLVAVPGWNGSGPAHWQSIWRTEHEGWRCVEQRDWAVPDRGEWVNSLDEVVANCPRRVVIVAHSLGCVAFAHWASLVRERVRLKVAGAFLVAPADVERANSPQEVRGFGPMPKWRMPVPTLLIGSENDPCMTLRVAKSLAADWKSNFVNAGSAGHINVDSGHGPWPEGKALLGGFLRDLAAPVFERDRKLA